MCDYPRPHNDSVLEGFILTLSFPGLGPVSKKLTVWYLSLSPLQMS